MQAEKELMPNDDVHRSLCPINLALEVFGDKWTLLIIRDLMFAGKRHFRELLHSDEHIASNILADRLSMLVDHGLITKADDPTHKQKSVYRLSAMGIDLLPLLAQMGIWSRRYRPVSVELGATAAELEQGGPPLWDQLMADLRATHLGASAPSGAYEPARPVLRSRVDGRIAGGRE
jgi:DNA-binding HxlR family transcriptional regulator